MSRGLNKVMLIGHLGADPEVRYLESGSVVANFNLATTEVYTDRSGSKQSVTEWHRIELWDNLAKIAEQYLKKGSQVYIEGKLRTDSWEDKEGNKRSTVKVRALNMILLGSRSSEEGINQLTTSHTMQKPNSQLSDSDIPPFLSTDEEDDLPF